MAARTYPHSIRFTEEEWRAVQEAAERLDMSPGAFVRDAAALAAADELGLDEGRLTPELVELLKRTFRAAHVVAFLKREELEKAGRLEEFEEVAETARTLQNQTLGMNDEDEEDGEA